MLPMLRAVRHRAAGAQRRCSRLSGMRAAPISRHLVRKTALASCGVGGALLALQEPSEHWARCDAPLELDDGLAVGMDLIDTLVAHGQRRRIYDEKAARYDGSSVWLALSNLLRRVRERGLQMFGCCAAMTAAIWAKADLWTVGGSTLAWTSGSAAVISTLLAALLAVQRVVFGAPVSVPQKTVAALDKLWKERTEVEDQLLREIVTAETEDGGALQPKETAWLSGLGCSDQWWLVRSVAIVSPLPSPPKSSSAGASEPTGTEKEYAELFRCVLAGCGYHSWLCVPPRRQRQQYKNGKPLPPPSLRFSSDVLEEWIVPLQLLSSRRDSGTAGNASLEPPHAVDSFAVAATGLSLRVVLRHRGRGGGPLKASDGPEVIFASCEFIAHPSDIGRRNEAPKDGRGDPAAHQVVPFGSSGSSTGSGGRQRVVLIDRWSIAGGPANDREVKVGLAPLRLVLDRVTLAESAPEAVHRATVKRQLLYLGQDLVG